MARVKLAHNTNTPELSQIAKKLLVTIVRSSSGDRHSLASRVSSSSVGTISYGIYLYHLFVLLAFWKLLVIAREPLLE